MEPWQESWKKVSLRGDDLLLPCDMEVSTWAVIACDQYTSEPLYWEKVDALVKNRPSTRHFILPEAYLEEATEGDIGKIHANMKEALPSLRRLERPVLVRRTLKSGAVRSGLLAAVDLEQYDYRAGTAALVRASEGTIASRVPPRMRVRQDAALETAHVLMLIDDDGKTVIEPLVARKDGERLYEGELMLGGGHIQGRVLSEDAARRCGEALLALQRKNPDFLYAVGDGNHSLAAAKAYWESLKPAMDETKRENHPARFAMVEIVNVHDEALVFEPIHRVVSGLRDPLAQLQAAAKKHGWTVEKGDGEKGFTIVAGGYEVLCHIVCEPALGVGALQQLLDDILLPDKSLSIDYVHGEASVRALCASGDVGFLLPPMPKSMLFEAIRRGGVLPRKTFSMGYADEKRFYMECRRIGPA